MNRLWIKLTLAFLAIAMLAVGLSALLSAQATGSQFRQYVVRRNLMGQTALAQSLVAYYANRGSWDGVDALVADLEQAGVTGMGAGMGMGMGRGQRGSALPVTIADADGRVVFDATGQFTGQRLSPAVLAEGLPLSAAGGRAIGTLLSLEPASLALDAQGQAFLDRVKWSVVWAGLAAAGLALILGVFVSWRLTAPVRRLTAAAQAIAAGNLAQRAAVAGSDEIGQLGGAFNLMAANLERGEILRRNLMADVAHELRTPLTVIQGNLQAILDGVYPLDQEQVAGLYDETRLLTRLVEDLRDLALAEAGQLRLERAPVDVVALARDAAAKFAAAAEAGGVSVTLGAADYAIVSGDADRLSQVLRNLLSNALRHTPAGGQVTLRVAMDGDRVVLTVTDTGTGIPVEDLLHVFDRFYRGDKSRSRRGGGSGLGLAITRQLVVAHGGEISVVSQPGQGATFTVGLPAA